MDAHPQSRKISKVCKNNFEWFDKNLKSYILRKSILWNINKRIETLKNVKIKNKTE